MKDRNYLLFIIFAILSLFFLVYPSKLSFQIDDFSTRVFYTTQKNQVNSSDILVVEIADQCLARVDSKWPFRRSLYAQFLEKLKGYPPKAVGFDIVFSGKADQEAEDKALSLALEGANFPVVLAYVIDSQANPIYPQREFRELADIALVNVPSGRDGKIRHARGYFDGQDFFSFSLPIKLSSYFYGVKPERAANTILVEASQIKTDQGGVFPINYLLRPEDFNQVLFSDVIAGNFDPELFFEKIVLIGATAPIVHDIHPTPLGRIPGVYIHANVILEIINNRLIRPLPFFFNLLALFAVFLLVACFFFRYTFFRSFFLSLGLLLLLFWLDFSLKLNNLRLDYGRIVVSSLVFIFLLAVYTYVRFLFAAARVKARAVVNPLTGLSNVRYFFERFSFNLNKIPKTKKYLVVVCLEDFRLKAASLDFKGVRDFWQDLDLVFFGYSKLWCNYSDEVIVGEVKSIKKLETLRDQIYALLIGSKAGSKIKIGAIRASSKLLQKNTITYLIDKIKKDQKDIVIFKNSDIKTFANQKIKVFDFLSSLYSDTEEKNKNLLEIIEKLKEEEEKTKNAYLQLIHSLVAALESKDPYTQGHTDRVCKFSLMLADKLKLSDTEREKIKKAALLHDLGKIGILDFVLHKKDKLTDSEFGKIKEHSAIGAKILKPVDEFEEILPYVLYHHENFDGTGYPHGLAGNFIPLGARIIAIADVFDALITGRDYKKAFTPEKTVEILREMKGKRLDPDLVEVFFQVLKDAEIITSN